MSWVLAAPGSSGAESLARCLPGVRAGQSPWGWREHLPPEDGAERVPSSALEKSPQWKLAAGRESIEEAARVLLTRQDAWKLWSGDSSPFCSLEAQSSYQAHTAARKQTAAPACGNPSAGRIGLAGAPRFLFPGAGKLPVGAAVPVLAPRAAPSPRFGAISSPCPGAGVGQARLGNRPARLAPLSRCPCPLSARVAKNSPPTRAPPTKNSPLILSPAHSEYINYRKEKCLCFQLLHSSEK